MKLSKNFVNDYIDIENISINTLAEDMTRVGNEYDSAQKLISATKLIIGEVVECENHPDSDHLHICKVNIGSEVLNIVCGAPNVRKGLKVIVALPGAELPGGIKIKKGNIRGQESNGMLCSLAELGLENKFLTEADKKGIHELPVDCIIGENPIKAIGLDDEVIDFELTANRGDLLSILGMAYELGAIYDRPVKEIDLSHNEQGEDLNKNFKIAINTENCKLFLSKKVENVEIKESPDFIKNRLIASGIRPINNVVDISNYVMLELGQPLHFYNADSLNNMLEVRMAEEGEKLITLDNIERILTTNDIVISDGKKAIGLAGVMGGLDTEVTENTKNIIIEAAIFDNVKVRMTSNKILRSEASNRFEKGLDPNRTYMALERAAKLLEEYASGKVVTGKVVYDITDVKPKDIEISFKNICDVLGMNIPNQDILDVFRKLGFTSSVNEELIKVTVPTRRLDISIKEDLIEEVGRIYGLDNIEGKLPTVPMKKGSLDKTEREIRNKMISLGLNETLSYVLVRENEADMFTTDEFEKVKLLAPITEERSTLRYSVLTSLIKIYEYNKARNEKDVAIFEIGKGFYKKEKYGEDKKLAVLMSGKYLLGIENKQEIDFYVIKGIAEEILDYLGYSNRYSFVIPQKISSIMHPGQTADISVNNDIVGTVGKVHPSIEKENVYVLEINLDKLLAKKTGKMKFKEISKYPTISKDLAIIVDKKLSSDEIGKKIKKIAGSLLTNIEIFDVYEGKGIPKEKRSIAYSLSFGTPDRTLTDEEINSAMNEIINDLEKNFGAELRK